MAWQTLRSTTVYDNAWIEVSHRDVIAPTGHEGIYGLVHFKNLAVGVIPVDSEGYTWLVGQDRYTLGEWSWEIPEGGGPLGEDPVDTARRELLEETGLHADEIEHLLDLHTSNSVTDERAAIFVATDLTAGESAPDVTEQLELRRLPLVEAVELALAGGITDAMSVAGLLALAARRASGRSTDLG